MRQPNRTTVDHTIIDDLLATRNSKWTVTVVLHLRRETMRFSELQRDIGSISPKALTSTLRALERDGFVLRTGYATIPPRVDYSLTEVGHEALRMFEALEAFAARHWNHVMESRRIFDANQAQPPLQLVLRAGGER